MGGWREQMYGGRRSLGSVAVPRGDVASVRPAPLVVAERAPLALAGLLVLAVAFWTWFGLTQRSITTDDGISIQAARSVLEHGYQRFPSGFIYSRGVLPHYLVAGSIALFGLNNFAVMAPALVMAVATMLLVYLLARDALGRPWAGVLACALLLALDIQAFYATSARMYVPLQFMATLAAYSAWKGFVQGSRWFQGLTFLALAGAMLTHEEGGILLLAVPAAILAVAWMLGRDLLSLLSLPNVAGAALTLAVALFVYVYPLPDPMPAVTEFGGVPPGHVEFNASVRSWVVHVFQLERALPYGLAWSPVVLFLVGKSVLSRGRERGPAPGLVFVVTLLAVSGAAVLLMTTRHSSRFWLFVLPLYALLLSYAALGLLVGLRAALGGRGSAVPARRARWNAAALLAVLGAGLAVNTAAVALADETDVAQLLARGYLPSCSGSTCAKSVEHFYLGLRAMVEPGDVVVSTNPMVTAYYLGRVDGFLRQRIGPGGSYSSFREATDEYFGVPIVDTEEELYALARDARRVWVVVDYKGEWAVGPDALGVVQREFVPVHQREGLSAYRNAR